MSLVGATICASSGLNIVASSGQSVFRVARTQYGPVNPPPRVPGEHPVEDWSRWDTPGRTIYGCSSATGAFVEVLEYIRPDPPATLLSDLFDDVEPDDAATFAAQVAKELPQHGAMPYRSISKAGGKCAPSTNFNCPTAVGSSTSLAPNRSRCFPNGWARLCWLSVRSST